MREQDRVTPSPRRRLLKQALGGTLTLSAAQPAAPRPGLRLSAALPWSQSPVSGT